MSSLQLGQVVMTAGVASDIAMNPAMEEELRKCLKRHESKDWGNICEEDWALNDESAKADEEGREGDAILSSYDLSSGATLWIITEWNRTVTTLLYPEEY